MLWKPLKNLGRPLRVLDVATGFGDVPLGLWKKAKAAGVPLEVAGCDISPTAIEAAKQNAPGIHFFVHDAIRDPLPTGFDVVTCSLFLHHLDNDSAIILLKRMAEAARSRVLVNDLARSRFNFLAVWVACRILSRSRVVRFDGPASVRSAYSPAEALALAERAGLKNARVANCAFRVAICSNGRSMNDVWDAVVIGAGPAGALTARELARLGLRVLLVDRAKFPRNKVCGCCLNGAALAALRELGLGSIADAGVPLTDMKLAAGAHPRLCGSRKAWPSREPCSTKRSWTRRLRAAQPFATALPRRWNRPRVKPRSCE